MRRAFAAIALLLAAASQLPAAEIRDQLSHHANAAIWRGTELARSILDPMPDRCFSELPAPPSFWGEAPACGLGDEPADGLPQDTRRYAVAQYAWALDAPPLSPACSKSAERWYEADHKLQESVLRRPDPTKCTWGIAGLSPANVSRQSTTAFGTQRSVLVTLFDALGRGTYHRQLHAGVLDAADGYAVYDFTRFHILDCCSRRNIVAAYTGRVAEIFHSLSARPLPPAREPQPDEEPCSAGSDQPRRCAEILWQRYRDNGWATADQSHNGALGYACDSPPVTARPNSPAARTRYYMGACNRDCSKLTGQPLLTARTAETRPLRATASVFHAAKRLPLFATSIVHSAHNAEMSVGDIGCELSSYIRTVRESSARNGVDLPLIVLWAALGGGPSGAQIPNPGHAGALAAPHHPPQTHPRAPAPSQDSRGSDQVPKTLLAEDADLKRNLDANRQRLISALDLHFTLAEFALHPNPNPNRTAAVEGSLITRRNFFRDTVPLNRACSDAGIEQAWCQCAKWTPCASFEVSRHARAALATVNSWVAALQTPKATACATALALSPSATQARATASPPSIELLATLRAGRREAVFKITMACDNCSSWNRLPTDRCLPDPPLACRVSTVPAPPSDPRHSLDRCAHPSRGTGVQAVGHVARGKSDLRRVLRKHRRYTKRQAVPRRLTAPLD